MPQGGEDRSIVMGGRWSTPPEESGQISVPLPGRFEPYTPGPNSTLWNGTVRPIGEPDQPGQTPGAPPALGGGRDGVRIVRPDGPVIEPPRGEQPASVPPALATREEMVNGVPLRMMKRHDVREGESLYGITRQAYGDGSLWNKVAEYNKGKVMANGSVREGVTLLLPPKEALLGRQLPASAGTPAAPSPAPARKVEPSGTRPSDNSGGRSGASAAPRTYTVQRGDVLSEVARKTLGSSKRWTEILALNSDTLDDGDTLVAGMVLKLPAR
ncbi:MAG: LysM peptidoglycan-binding domain-containing protein [Phycisphaerales bacterium]